MKKRIMSLLIMTFVFTLILSSFALASTDKGTEFQSLYDKVIGWVTGLPAIIIAIGVAILGVVRAFQSGGFMWAFSGILVATLIFLIPNIVSGLGGCTF